MRPSVIGIGDIGASALAASVGDFKQFKSGPQFGAWLGLVPRQNSSGGKTSLGRITKRGDDYLRTLLIQGAKSAVMSAAQTRRPDLALAGATDGARGLAEGLRGDGQQERPHPVGGDDARRRLRPQARQRQAAGQAVGRSNPSRLHRRARPPARPECRASRDIRSTHTKVTSFHPRRALEDAFDRSDRQLVNSINPAWRQSCPTPYARMEPG